MDPNTLRGIYTVIVLIVFIGICLWVYSAHNKKDHDASAQLPFEDDDLEQQTLRKESEKKSDE